MTTITIDRATVEQALEAMRRAVPTGKITLYEWDRAISDLSAALAKQRLTDAQQGMERSIESLKAALAQQAEPVEPAPLKRGITGRCTRKVCECEKEGLGPECIHLEPVIDGYPLWSGIPKAEPVEPVAGHVFNVTVTGRLHEWEPTTFAFALRDGKHALYTAPPRRKPLTDEEIERLWYPSAVMAEPGKRRVAFGRAVERAHGIGRQSDPQIEDRLARHGINPCPDCRGIGYDASGQLCWCQQNPSF